MVMESKTTSKTSCLKALLLKAWRERWTDLQWGINIKTVLPRGVSGDVYNLADCILQQAVVGSGANWLVLSYLRHSLSAQLVSHAAVLQRLSKYNHLSKVHCVFSLLEFLEGMLPGVTCCGKPEETVLTTAVLSIACWLLTILIQCKSSAQLTQKASYLFQMLMANEFYTSMMCLAKYNDPELFAEVNRKCIELGATLTESHELSKSVKQLEHLDVSTSSLPISSEDWAGSLIQNWLEVKLEGNPGASTTSICERLRLFQKLKGFDNSRFFAEILRGSLLCLHDVKNTPHESQWGAFVFLKLPYILFELIGKSDNCSIISAIELLLQHSALLDAVDANSSCSSLECLLTELAKARLISETQVSLMLEKRKIPESLKIDALSASRSIPKAIICAEPTVAGILKTLSKDYHQMQDPLLGMLYQVLTGQSFELIIALATVQGQLKTLVSRLISFNEHSKSGSDKTRSQLFDITFLMLVSIIQNYGTSYVLSLDGESLFQQWVTSCMVERKKPKAPEQLLRLGDPNTVEMLLQQFNGGEADFKPNAKWQDILFSIPGVMHEVLVAWEQGALVASDVKRILDAVKGRMCCLPLAATAWLCAYMRTTPQENVLKPVNMVQQLLAPPVSEDDSLKERWQLTSEIIRKMQKDVQLPLQTKSSHYLISMSPAIERLHQTWSVAISRGWLDHNSSKLFHCLLDTAGPRWLASAVVQELLKIRYQDKLQRGVDLALAAFHVDIGACTLELLTHVLPQLLYNDIQIENLMEPQLLSLAYLTSRCIYTSFDTVPDQECDEPPAKIARFSDASESTSLLSQLMSALRQLLSIFESGIQDGYFTQQTYFAFYLIKSMVEIKVSSTNTILAAIPSVLITDLLRTLPELFSYPLLLNLHDVYTTSGRINMARDLCVLRNYHLRNTCH